jgi:OmpA-OmpF porin, OOP family
MRPTLKIAACLGLAGLGGLGATMASFSPAYAADTPSAAQIIDSLSPNHGGGTMATRGIRLGGQPPAAAKPAPAATSASTGGAATAPADKPLEANLSVPFASGSATVSPAAAHVLDQLGEALASPKLAEFKFRVEGHTDTVGSPEANKSLSEQRAASVIDYLASKYSIDRSRLTASGMGEDGLLVPTGPGVPNASNRRVLVVNLGQ